MDIHAAIQKAKEIAQGVVLKEAPVADKQVVWVAESMSALQDAKLTGLVVPLEYGGAGQGLYALVRVCEELGKAYSSTGLCFGMHCVGTAVIAAKATDWQKKQYLAPIAQGECITALA